MIPQIPTPVITQAILILAIAVMTGLFFTITQLRRIQKELHDIRMNRLDEYLSHDYATDKKQIQDMITQIDTILDEPNSEEETTTVVYGGLNA